MSQQTTIKCHSCRKHYRWAEMALNYDKYEGKLYWTCPYEHNVKEMQP